MACNAPAGPSQTLVAPSESHPAALPAAGSTKMQPLASQNNSSKLSDTQAVQTACTLPISPLVAQIFLDEIVSGSRFKFFLAKNVAPDSPIEFGDATKNQLDTKALYGLRTAYLDHPVVFSDAPGSHPGQIAIETFEVEPGAVNIMTRFPPRQSMGRYRFECHEGQWTKTHESLIRYKPIAPRKTRSPK